MIITENQFVHDTKADVFSILLEKTFSQVLERTLYIFISHKHEEGDYVYRLKDILNRYGFTGYVDWEDDDMPLITSGETAIKLKDRIRKAKKFILIATEAAIDSKWCNWEVGFADAHKYENHLAIFPIKGDYLKYKGEEYLQIYPSIQVRWTADETAFEYYVKYPNGKEVDLRNWLNL